MNRADRINLDLDIRLSEIWTYIDNDDYDDDQLEILATLLRASYAAGYIDGTLEDGTLFTDHGARRP